MSFREDYRRSMREAASLLAREAQAQGAEVLYFSHWSPRSWPDEESKWRGNITIEETYLSIAQQTGGRVAFAGRLWLKAHEARVAGLYSADGHHASVKGAWAAALAIVAALGDTDPGTSTWFPASGDQEIPGVEQDLLRCLASDLIARR